jgi:hypothetical protein
MKGFNRKDVQEKCAKLHSENALKKPSSIKAVLLMDLLVRHGYTWESISQKLNEKGYKTPTGKEFCAGSANGLYLRFKRKVNLKTLTL